MNRRFIFCVYALLFVRALASTSVMAASFPIDPSNPNNGIFDIYSVTFDGPLVPPADPFFGGTLPPTGGFALIPNPTGVLATADTSLCKQAYDSSNPSPPITPPCTTLYPTATPSALDLVLSAGNTRMTINGGNVFFPNLTMVISGGTANHTEATIEGASMINFAPSSGTIPIDGNGVSVIEVGPPFGQLADGTKVDFATFTEMVTGCAGPLCGLISVLTLDMIRYRLTVDWDPTFNSFDADFIGQTANTSMVFATLDSAVIPVPGAAYLFVSALALLGWVRRKTANQ